MRSALELHLKGMGEDGLPLESHDLVVRQVRVAGRQASGGGLAIWLWSENRPTTIRLRLGVRQVETAGSRPNREQSVG